MNSLNCRKNTNNYIHAPYMLFISTCSDNYRISDSQYVFVNWGGQPITNTDVCNFIVREFFLAGFDGYVAIYEICMCR